MGGQTDQPLVRGGFLHRLFDQRQPLGTAGNSLGLLANDLEKIEQAGVRHPFEFQIDKCREQIGRTPQDC